MPDRASQLRCRGPPPPVTANSADWVVISPTGAFIGSFPNGAYTFKGGPSNDVGAFTAQLTVSPAPTFTSPASSNGLVVTRRLGMAVAWNPGGATGPIPLALMNHVGIGSGRTANCTVLASDGSFTIPPYALLRYRPPTVRSSRSVPAMCGPRPPRCFPQAV